MTNFDIRNEMMTQLPSPYRLLHTLQRSGGFVMDLHSHDFFHILFITSGVLAIHFQGRDYQISEGQAAVLPPHIPHSLSSEDGYRQIGIDILDIKDERGMHDLLCKTFPDGFSIVTMLKLPRTYEELSKAIRKMTALDTLKILNAAEALVLALIEQSCNTRNPSFRESFLDMLSKDNAFHFTLDQMCKQMQMSKTHLERLTRIEFGCGCIEYCSKLKLMKACLFLQDTDVSIKLIAENMGFYDESHFSRFFKKRIGATPTQYRNQSRRLI